MKATLLCMLLSIFIFTPMTKPHFPNAEDFYSSGVLAGLLGVSTRTIQIWCDQGFLKYTLTPGGHRRIRLHDARIALSLIKNPTLAQMHAEHHLQPTVISLFSRQNPDDLKITVAQERNSCEFMYRNCLISIEASTSKELHPNIVYVYGGSRQQHTLFVASTTEQAIEWVNSKTSFDFGRAREIIIEETALFDGKTQSTLRLSALESGRVEGVVRREVYAVSRLIGNSCDAGQRLDNGSRVCFTRDELMNAVDHYKSRLPQRKKATSPRNPDMLENNRHADKLFLNAEKAQEYGVIIDEANDPLGTVSITVPSSEGPQVFHLFKHTQTSGDVLTLRYHEHVQEHMELTAKLAALNIYYEVSIA